MADTFDSLRPRIVDYLHERGIDPRKRFRCLNPAHLDRDPSMGFDPKRNKAHCFACGADYDLFDLLTMDENLSTPLEALISASRHFGDGSADRPAKRAAPESEGWGGEGPPPWKLQGGNAIPSRRTPTRGAHGAFPPFPGRARLRASRKRGCQPPPRTADNPTLLTSRRNHE